MDSDNDQDHFTKLLRAQTHIFNQTYGFINSMSLKCAIDLCIPDVVHKYDQPMPLSKLIASLPIHPSKACFIPRLMQILTHSGFFSQHNNSNATENDEQEVSYVLTDASKLLLKDHPFGMISLPQVILDPIFLNPWFQFSTWFTNEDRTPFYTQHGVTLWDYTGRDPKLNHLFNDAMANDTRLVSNVLIEKCKGVFNGLESLVDVGGGTGTMAKAIAKSFPHLKCVVFDLPHVVDGLQEREENIKYVAGDMFEAIPSADSIMLKGVLHDWKDEECLKILKICKEAIAGKDKGKVIIIDAVLGNKKGDSEDQTKLFYDMEMMVLVAGKERNEKDWAKLFFSAGFNNYKITSVLGFKSLIEVYP